MFDQHPLPPATTPTHFGPHVRQDSDDTQYIQVCFSPPDGTYTEEIAWVQVEKGDTFVGIGIVRNHLIFCASVRYGDRITYGEGRPDHLPRHLETTATASELAPTPAETPIQALQPTRRSAPANPVKGSQYTTKYGQRFEFDGSAWIPVA